jgi:DNA-binding MarR family transcriptional regulator
MPKPRALSLVTFLPYRLSVAANLVSDVIATAYEPVFSLRNPEWRVIAIIADKGALSQQGVCVASRMDKVTVSRAAIALCERKLLERHPNPDDKRSHLLVLTESGNALYEQVVPKALELEALIFARFSKAERQALEILLGRIEAGALGLTASSE